MKPVVRFPSDWSEKASASAAKDQLQGTDANAVSVGERIATFDRTAVDECPVRDPRSSRIASASPTVMREC